MTQLSHDLTVQAADALGVQYRDTMQQGREAAGLPQNWGQLWVILEHDPAPMTVDWSKFYAPYNNPTQHVERLQKFADEGHLIEIEKGSYRLSDRTRAGVKQVIAALEIFVGNLQTLSQDKLERLAELLARGVNAALNSDEPADRSILKRNRKSDPGENAPVTYRILQYLTDFNAFRDDCHHAAWKPRHVEGYEWETLSFVWRDDATTSAALAEKLPQRGYNEADYAQALKNLEARGWIHAHGDHYHITGEGARIRQAAEDETERAYANAWKPLSADEQQELADLLIQFTEAVKSRELA